MYCRLSERWCVNEMSWICFRTSVTSTFLEPWFSQQCRRVLLSMKQSIRAPFKREHMLFRVLRKARVSLTTRGSLRSSGFQYPLTFKASWGVCTTPLQPVLEASEKIGSSNLQCSSLGQGKKPSQESKNRQWLISSRKASVILMALGETVALEIASYTFLTYSRAAGITREKELIFPANF